MSFFQQIWICFQSSIYMFHLSGYRGCRYIWGSDKDLFGTATFFQMQFKTPWWCMVSWLDFYHLSWPILQRPRHRDKAFDKLYIYTSNNDFQHQLGAGISEKKHKASYSTKLKIYHDRIFLMVVWVPVKDNHRFFLPGNQAGSRAQILKRCPYCESRISKKLKLPVSLVSSTPLVSGNSYSVYIYIIWIYTYIVINYSTCKMN